ncbi:MAG: Streptothricin hydrolase [Stenotrophomonas maltophilia]|nr:MAG: Streptothricin hydrolase [Stenotrophomonas maltophilia]
MRRALVIIDVQQALCQGPGAAWEAPALLQRLNALSAAARAAGVPVILVQHEDAELVQGTPGWALADGLEIADSDLRLRKTTPDSFHRTDLQQRLQALGVEHLVICGLQSDYCVDTSTRRALALGYPVTLVGDGHSTVDNGVISAQQIRDHHNATLSGISSFGPRARVLASAEVRFDA